LEYRQAARNERIGTGGRWCRHVRPLREMLTLLDLWGP